MILGGCGTTLEELTVCFLHSPMEGIYISPSYTQDDTIHQKSTCNEPRGLLYDQ